ncbi:MAG: TIR domain-containing protein [Gammaproteobacteria bacterium]
MSKKRVFISFDYDNDENIKTLLVGQSRNEDSPFELADWSIKEAVTGDWKAKARQRIRAVDVLIAICGKNTHTAAGVDTELSIAQEEGIPYFLLAGYSDEVVPPKMAKKSDKVYKWSWENVKKLLAGAR